MISCLPKQAFREGSCLSNNVIERHIQIINEKVHEKCTLGIAVSLRGKYKTKWRQ